MAEFGRPPPLPGQVGYGRSETDQLAAETAAMEADVQQLRAHLESQNAAAAAVSAKGGSRWKSSRSTRGSMRGYANDVKERQDRRRSGDRGRQAARSTKRSAKPATSAQSQQQQQQPKNLPAPPKEPDESLQVHGQQRQTGKQQQQPGPPQQRARPAVLSVLRTDPARFRLANDVDEMDEEAERAAFASAVAEWRSKGSDAGASSHVSIVREYEPQGRPQQEDQPKPAPHRVPAPQLDFEDAQRAEHAAFADAVAEWRRGGGGRGGADNSGGTQTTGPVQPGAPLATAQSEELDEEAEHAAFRDAVAEWRSQGASTSTRVTLVRENDPPAQAVPARMAPGPAAQQPGASQRNESFAAAVAEWKRERAAIGSGAVTGDDGGGSRAAPLAATPADSQHRSPQSEELDEEAERVAFQEAVSEWRSQGSGHLSIVREYKGETVDNAPNEPAAATTTQASRTPRGVTLVHEPPPAPGTSGHGLVGDGMLDEEAEHAAFAAAVEEWRKQQRPQADAGGSGKSRVRTRIERMPVAAAAVAAAHSASSVKTGADGMALFAGPSADWRAGEFVLEDADAANHDGNSLDVLLFGSQAPTQPQGGDERTHDVSASAELGPGKGAQIAAQLEQSLAGEQQKAHQRLTQMRQQAEARLEAVRKQVEELKQQQEQEGFAGDDGNDDGAQSPPTAYIVEEP